jgi:cell division septation protein DedD
MALNLRTPPSERYLVADEDEGRGGSPRLGAALSDWDREDASRNPGGMAPGGISSGGMAYVHSEPNDDWRRWIRGGFAALALAGFVGVLWYAYEWGMGGEDAVELPTVSAETGPEKEKPSDPGGLQVPYQDQLVMNEDGAAQSTPQVERLLPPPEAPLTPPALTGIAPSYDELPPALPQDDTAASDPVAEPPAAESAPQAGAVASLPEPPAAAGGQSASDGQGDGQGDVRGQAGESQAAAAEIPEPPAPKAEAPKAQAPKAQAEPSEPAATQSAAAQPATTQSTTAQSTTASNTAVAADPTGQFVVQLVSLKDSGAAEREWSRLQGVFPQLLGDKSLLLQKADVSGIGTVYRLRAGPFATRAKASQVCAELKAKQQDCLVANR